MVDKVQDMNLPSAAVLKIIKDALPDGINMGKDARAIISKAATVFVLYLTSSTSAVAKAHNHKTLMPENVLTALDEIDFENFVGPLRETLDKYRTIVKSKKAEIKSSNNNETEPNEEVPAETEN